MTDSPAKVSDEKKAGVDTSDQHSNKAEQSGQKFAEAVEDTPVSQNNTEKKNNIEAPGGGLFADASAETEENFDNVWGTKKANTLGGSAGNYFFGLPAALTQPPSDLPVFTLPNVKDIQSGFLGEKSFATAYTLRPFSDDTKFSNGSDASNIGMPPKGFLVKAFGQPVLIPNASRSLPEDDPLAPGGLAVRRGFLKGFSPLSWFPLTAPLQANLSNINKKTVIDHQFNAPVLGQVEFKLGGQMLGPTLWVGLNHNDVYSKEGGLRQWTSGPAFSLFAGIGLETKLRVENTPFREGLYYTSALGFYGAVGGSAGLQGTLIPNTSNLDLRDDGQPDYQHRLAKTHIAMDQMNNGSGSEGAWNYVLENMQDNSGSFVSAQEPLTDKLAEVIRLVEGVAPEDLRKAMTDVKSGNLDMDFEAFSQLVQTLVDEDIISPEDLAGIKQLDFNLASVQTLNSQNTNSLDIRYPDYAVNGDKAFPELPAHVKLNNEDDWVVTTPDSYRERKVYDGEAFPEIEDVLEASPDDAIASIPLSPVRQGQLLAQNTKDTLKNLFQDSASIAINKTYEFGVDDLAETINPLNFIASGYAQLPETLSSLPSTFKNDVSPAVNRGLSKGMDNLYANLGDMYKEDPVAMNEAGDSLSAGINEASEITLQLTPEFKLAQK
jgi:hypothetical protein